MKIICEYCKVYETSSKRKNDYVKKGRKDILIQIRKCNIKKDYVKANDIACERFIITRFFYCKKKNIRIPIELCISRRERKIEGCRRCRQGKLIEGIYEKENEK